MKQHKAWQLRVSRTQLSTWTFEQTWVSPHDTTKFDLPGVVTTRPDCEGTRYMSAGDGATTDFGKKDVFGARLLERRAVQLLTKLHWAASAWHAPRQSIATNSVRDRV